MLNVLMEAWANHLRALDRLTAEMGRAMGNSRKEAHTIILKAEEPTPVTPPKPRTKWRRLYFTVPIPKPDWLGRTSYRIDWVDEQNNRFVLDHLVFKDEVSAAHMVLQLQTAYHDGLRVGSEGELPITADGANDGEDADNGAGDGGGERGGVRATADARAAGSED